MNMYTYNGCIFSNRFAAVALKPNTNKIDYLKIIFESLITSMQYFAC